MKTLLAVLSMIPGLTATPPLPPRTVDTSSYSDFEVTLVEKYADNRDVYSKGTCYKINVKNTGEGYIKHIGFTFEGGYYSYKTELEDNVSNSQVIAPNQESVFVISANYDTDTIDQFEFHVSAYTAFTDELEVTGCKTLNLHQNSNFYTYSVDLSFGHTGRDKYCYGAAIKAYVDEKETYFIVNEWDNFYFTTTKEVEGDANGEVEVVKMFKTEYSHYEQEQSYNNIFYDMSKGCHGSILYGAPAIASFGLITTFVIVLKRAHKKKYSK